MKDKSYINYKISSKKNELYNHKTIWGIDTCIILFDQLGIYSSKKKDSEIIFSPSFDLVGSFLSIVPYNYKARTLLYDSLF